MFEFMLLCCFSCCSASLPFLLLCVSCFFACPLFLLLSFCVSASFFFASLFAFSAFLPLRLSTSTCSLSSVMRFAALLRPILCFASFLYCTVSVSLGHGDPLFQWIQCFWILFGASILGLVLFALFCLLYEFFLFSGSWILGFGFWNLDEKGKQRRCKRYCKYSPTWQILGATNANTMPHDTD